MAGPIKPQDVQVRKNENLPEEVFQAFNELIVKYWNGSYANVSMAEAANLIQTKMNISHKQVFERGLLDVEDAYRKAGWEVNFDKPGYNENYAPYYLFSKESR